MNYTTLIKAAVPPHRDFGITLSLMRRFKPRQVTKASLDPVQAVPTPELPLLPTANLPHDDTMCARLAPLYSVARSMGRRSAA